MPPESDIGLEAPVFGGGSSSTSASVSEGFHSVGSRSAVPSWNWGGILADLRPLTVVGWRRGRRSGREVEWQPCTVEPEYPNFWNGVAKSVFAVFGVGIESRRRQLQNEKSAAKSRGDAKVDDGIPLRAIEDRCVRHNDLFLAHGTGLAVSRNSDDVMLAMFGMTHQYCKKVVAMESSSS